MTGNSLLTKFAVFSLFSLPDFLTPVRQFNDSVTRELVDITNPKHFADPKMPANPQLLDHSQSTVVHNPYELQRKFYDRDMWCKCSLFENHSVVKFTTGREEPFYTDPPDLDPLFLCLTDEYKDELYSLGYTMIEYDWLIMDNITFTLEVCLDHVSHYLFCMWKATISK
jgi:hypothetical protein